MDAPTAGVGCDKMISKSSTFHIFHSHPAYTPTRGNMSGNSEGIPTRRERADINYLGNHISISPYGGSMKALQSPSSFKSEEMEAAFQQENVRPTVSMSK
jgi:hypothetical protein